MSDLEAAGWLMSFLSGLISGLIIQYVRFKHSLKVEKIMRIIPKLEGAQPIVLNLAQDTQYATTIQYRSNGDELEEVLRKIGNLLDQFGSWHSEFLSSGMSPELESLDYTLLARLNGLSSHARLFRMHGLPYVSQNIDKLSEYCKTCDEALRLRLSS